MITKKELENEIKNCENLLKEINKQIEKSEENDDIFDCIYFSNCKKEEEEKIELFKWLIEKYCR